MKTDFSELGFLGDLPGQSFFRVLDGAPDALILVDAKAQIRFVNAQTENLFGYARHELIGSPVEILIPERARHAHVQRRNAFVAAPSLRAMGTGLELYGRRKDGSEFPVEISLSPLETKEGTFVASAIRDVTERKRVELAEAQAKLATQRLLSAVDSIEGMFGLFDNEDKVVLCNSTFRQFFAPAIHGQMVGRAFAELLDGNLKSDVFDLNAASTAEFRARWLTYRQHPAGTLDVRTKDGRTLRVTDRLTAEQGVVTTILDITDDVTREEELRQARELAEAASAAKSEFLSSMSHELRTPMNAVLGFAQLLVRDKKTPPTERQKEKLDHILKGGEHLLRLIDDVLDLARIEAGRVTISLEPVSVAEVLNEVRTTLSPMASRAGVEIEIGPVPAEAQRVLADRTRFSQVLMNYGSNAIKYGQPEGAVTFATSMHGPDRLRVSVVDRGKGVPLDKQEKLFQPFQRAGQELGPIEGTGIGLTISKLLAELMGGSVGFRSVPGEGSEFWVELALDHQSVATPTVEGSAREGGWSLAEAGGVRHVVVYVEDNPSNIEFMRQLMEDFESVELLTAPTAEIGIELVRSRLPAVVIMDINLPGINGIEAAKKLREWPETRPIPVIALSAAALMSDRQRSDAAVFHRYLTKPIKVDELVGTLEGLLSP